MQLEMSCGPSFCHSTPSFPQSLTKVKQLQKNIPLEKNLPSWTVMGISIIFMQCDLKVNPNYKVYMRQISVETHLTNIFITFQRFINHFFIVFLGLINANAFILA